MLAILDKIGRGFSRRSIENPTYSLNDPALWDLMTGGTTSDSGVKVSRKAALSIAAYWRGVNLIANGCAGVGLHLFRRTSDDDSERDKANPVYKLVRERPNQYMTAFDFWRTIIGHGLGGNGYAYIERMRSGDPVQLLPLDPAATYPVRENGRLWYVTTVMNGDVAEKLKIPSDDILHVKGFGYDGLVGYSVIDILCDTIGGAIATRKHATQFYKNGAVLGGVLEVPTSLTDAAVKQLRDQWNSLHTGVGNQHKTAVLTNSTKFSPTSVDAQKAQLLETRNFDRKEIALIFGLPPHKLGDDSRTSYNSLEMEERAVAKEAFDPWWIQIEDECRAKLLTTKQQDSGSHFFKWNRQASIQTDTKALAEALSVETSGGLMTINEARGKLELPPLDNGIGDVVFYPSGANSLAVSTKTGLPIAPLNQPMEPTTDNDPEPMPADDATGNRASTAAKKLGIDAMMRLCTRIGEKAKRASLKPGEFLSFVHEVPDNHGDVFDEIWGPHAEMIAALGGNGDIRAGFFASVEKRMVDAADCQPESLPEYVTQAIGAMRQDAISLVEAAVNGDK